MPRFLANSVRIASRASRPSDTIGGRTPNAIAVLGLQILSAGPPCEVETYTFVDAVLNG